MPTANDTNEFAADVAEIRRRAREHMQDGPVTNAYGADREKVVKLLNEASLFTIFD